MEGHYAEDDMSLLSDKIVVVTGVSSGIGWAMVSTFIEHGAQVIGVARRDPPALENSSASDAFTFLRGDITVPATLEQVAELATQRYGRVDVLVNNAGIVTPASPL